LRKTFNCALFKISEQLASEILKRLINSNKKRFNDLNLASSNSQTPFETLKLQIEALLFSCEGGLSIDELRQALGSEPISLQDLKLALKDLSQDYSQRSFSLQEINSQFQLRTKPEFSSTVQNLYSSKPRQLSKIALETLAIVAYRQPVTRAEVNAIRTVDSSSILITLKEKGLVEISGTRKTAGNPAEYKTTAKFLEVFGLKNLSELPSLRSLQMSSEQQQMALEALKKVSELDGHS
jgi:segregation and condensation protein B